MTLNGNEYDEVVLMASGKALELLLPIISELKVKMPDLYQYNCLPTQYVIEEDPFTIVICIKVRLSKIKPNNMNVYRMQPQLYDLIKRWRYLMKDIKKAKSKYLRDNAKSSYELSNKAKWDQKDEDQNSSKEKLKSHHDTCSICIENFTEESKLVIQDLVNSSLANKDKIGISSNWTVNKISDPNDRKLIILIKIDLFLI